MVKKKSKKLLQSTIAYDKKIAMGLSKTAYYEAQAKNMAMYDYIVSEKEILATPKWDYVSKLLDAYKTLGDNGWESPVGRLLQGIYNKNSSAAIKKEGALNTHLMDILGKPEILLLAYKFIKGNKGALTKASYLGLETTNSFTQDQTDFYYKSNIFPDGFSLQDIFVASKLLRKGLYPWGASRRVYVPKPGVIDKKRPITIPPFMDKVVQKAIALILESIYEPYFEIQNRSFGFRPNKGVHDAIVAVTSNYSSGKITAIEGDIEAAYDTVSKTKLINILAKKIADRKFLNVIRDRLEYEYVETNELGEDKRFKPTLGIPQGGIDSPYLFNIYMKELDDYVHTGIRDFLHSLNVKIAREGEDTTDPKKDFTAKRFLLHEYTEIINAISRERTIQKKLKKKIKDISDPEQIQATRSQFFESIKKRRLLGHKKNQIQTTDHSKKKLLFLYVRYADDWIFLFNGPKELAEIIKEMISRFLRDHLELKLSEKKTIITDIRKEPAKFLGYQLKHPSMGPLIKTELKDPTKHQRFSLGRRKGGTIIWSSPDSQRLINRFHMKGFCDKNGFPKELPWLSCFEDHVIIERYNAVIRGFGEFYFHSIRNNSALQRWIYILRFSCLKTLAQKYRTSISGIFKKFGTRLTEKSRKTIKITVEIKNKDKIMVKDWTLWTYKDLLNTVETEKRWYQRKKHFWEIEQGLRIGLYESKPGRQPAITNEDYLEKISWTSLRTQASFSMPCANENCGTMENVQQHHVKHIRKTAYALISGDLPFKKVMALRNRKQIPLCAECHRQLVHKGKYDGTALIKLAPTKLIDNRVLHVESYVKVGAEYFAKTLAEKGWVEKLQIKRPAEYTQE